MLREEGREGKRLSVHSQGLRISEGLCAGVVVPDAEHQRYKLASRLHSCIPVGEPLIPGGPACRHAVVVCDVTTNDHGGRLSNGTLVEAQGHELCNVPAAAHVPAKDQDYAVAGTRRRAEAPVRLRGDVRALALDDKPVACVNRQAVKERAVHVPAPLPQLLLWEAGGERRPRSAARRRTVFGVTLSKDPHRRQSRGHVHVHKHSLGGVLRQREVEVAGLRRPGPRVSALAMTSRPAG
mmetsp:Transcript_991/g.3030  ORF Transcript_991/g.3030 Transcript_991/m.3030 type:complete len:238 (+) Transcript_991:762-1475(+)